MNIVSPGIYCSPGFPSYRPSICFFACSCSNPECTWKALEHLFVQLCGGTGSDEIRANFRRGFVLCTRRKLASVTQKGFSNSMRSDYFAVFVFKSNQLDVAFLAVHSL